MSMVIVHKAEMEFLRHCLSCVVGDGHQLLELKTPASFNWDVFLDLSNKHGVLPLVYKAMKNIEAEVPPNIYSRVADCYRKNAQRNLFLTAELLHILQHFFQRGISIIPLKGPVLSQFLYDDVSMRQFCDLDVLVHEYNMPQIDTMIRARSYTLPGKFQITGDESKHRVYIRTDNGIILEVHWRLSVHKSPSEVPLDDIWDEQTSFSLGGLTIPFFSLENLVLLLCNHGFRHSWHKMAWLCDLAMLLKTRPTIDWETVFAKARRYRMVNRLIMGMVLIDKILAMPLPETLTSRYSVSRPMTFLADRHYESTFHPTTYISTHLSIVRFHTITLDHWQDKLIILPRSLKQILEPSLLDKALVVLPDRLYFLYYIIRPFRILYAYILAPVIKKSRSKKSKL